MLAPTGSATATLLPTWDINTQVTTNVRADGKVYYTQQSYFTN